MYGSQSSCCSAENLVSGVKAALAPRAGCRASKRAHTRAVLNEFTWRLGLVEEQSARFAPGGSRIVACRLPTSPWRPSLPLCFPISMSASAGSLRPRRRGRWAAGASPESPRPRGCRARPCRRRWVSWTKASRSPTGCAARAAHPVGDLEAFVQLTHRLLHGRARHPRGLGDSGDAPAAHRPRLRGRNDPALALIEMGKHNGKLGRQGLVGSRHATILLPPGANRVDYSSTRP